jgi:hypothetical protein
MQAAHVDPLEETIGRVVVDILMSLDGVATAPGADLGHGLGVGGGKGMRAQGRLPGQGRLRSSKPPSRTAVQA